MSDYPGTRRWMYAMSAAPKGGRAETIRTEICSDELLHGSAQQSGRGEYPFYSQRRMEELSAREEGYTDEASAALGQSACEPDLPATDPGPLARMVVDAQLTRRQRTVVRWLAQGLSQRQIAEMLGVSEASVTRLKQAAFDEMRRAARRNGDRHHFSP